MSDAPETRRGATAPVPMTVQPSTDPMPNAPPKPAARAATQMSASAVPSTLESPQEAVATGGAAPPPASLPASLKHDVTERDDAARRNAELDGGGIAPAIVSSARGGPATLMSPAVAPLGDKPASPSLAPEDAVIDVGAPAHAFMPHGSSPAYGGGAGMMHQGPHGAVGGAAGRRPMSTTTIAMLVVGGVVGIIMLAALVVGLFYVGERRKAEAAESGRAQHGPSATGAPAVPEASRTPLRFGGSKARLAVTSSGALDPEAVRAALAGALPKVDVCFAAAELEPPNHETAAYELDVQPSGDVKKVEIAGATNRATRLDACVLLAFRGTRLPKAARASVVKLTFSAPLDVH